MFNLREYQEEGIRLAYSQFNLGKQRVIFWLATGGGKSRCFTSVTNDMVVLNIPVVIVVRRRDLIEQASKNLDAFKIKHGVYMSNHRRYRPHEMVQVCSIDTLDARSVYPHSDKAPFLIIDEMQDCTPRGKKYTRFLDAYPNSRCLGFSATPFSDNSLFDAIIKPIEAHELMEKGNLVPVKMFTPEGQIDTSDVKIKRNGLFDEKELFQASSGQEIIGDFVRDWRLYSQERPTVLFAVNVEHSKMIAEAFNEAGIRACHADANTPREEREKALKGLANGKIQVLCNVNIFSTGVDVPEIACIQVCRPTQSLIWYIQALGRGLRPSLETGKTNCIIIDNAGNTFRFGNPYRVHTAKLGKAERHDPDEEDLTIRQCKLCHFIFDVGEKICPECGHTNPPVERKIKTAEGELIEYDMTPEEREMMDRGLIVADCHKLKHVANRTEKIKKKKNWTLYRLKDKYGSDKMEQYSNIILEALSDMED